MHILITIDPKQIQRHAEVQVGDLEYRRGDEALRAMKEDEAPVTVAQYEAFREMVWPDGLHLAMDEAGQITVTQPPGGQSLA